MLAQQLTVLFVTLIHASILSLPTPYAGGVPNATGALLYSKVNNCVPITFLHCPIKYPYILLMLELESRAQHLLRSFLKGGVIEIIGFSLRVRMYIHVHLCVAIFA